MKLFFRQKKHFKYKSFGLAAGIPMILLGSPLVGYLIGVGVDNVFDIKPHGRMIFLFLGLVSGGFEVIKIIKKLNSINEEDD